MKKKATLVYIRWFDASYQRGECTREEMIPQVEMESAGLLVEESDETISIALDRYEGNETWRYIEHIPKVNIRQIRRVKVLALGLQELKESNTPPPHASPAPFEPGPQAPA